MQTSILAHIFNHMTQTWAHINLLQAEKMADRSSILKQRPLPPTSTLGLLCLVGSFYRKFAVTLMMTSALFCLQPLSQPSPPFCLAAPFFMGSCAWPRGMLIAMTGTVSTCLHPCSPPSKAILDSAKQQSRPAVRAVVRGGEEWARGQLECEKDPLLSDSSFQQPHTRCT